MVPEKVKYTESVSQLRPFLYFKNEDNHLSGAPFRAQANESLEPLESLEFISHGIHLQSLKNPT
jgi:hypothetical protein